MNSRYNTAQALFTGGPPFEFHTPTNREQDARTHLLSQVVTMFGADQEPDRYVELIRYLETGLRAYDDPPQPPDATPPPDEIAPALADLELTRRRIESWAHEHYIDEAVPSFIDQLMAAIYPGAAS